MTDGVPGDAATSPAALRYADAFREARLEVVWRQTLAWVASGDIGRLLVERSGGTVDGVECVAEAPERARASYREFVVGDLERSERRSVSGPDGYALALDVIEHTRGYGVVEERSVPRAGALVRLRPELFVYPFMLLAAPREDGR